MKKIWSCSVNLNNGDILDETCWSIDKAPTLVDCYSHVSEGDAKRLARKKFRAFQNYLKSKEKL